jgi:hypothetical protein
MKKTSIYLLLLITLFQWKSADAQVDVWNPILFNGDSLSRTIYNVGSPTQEQNIATVASEVYNTIQWSSASQNGNIIQLSSAISFSGYKQYMAFYFRAASSIAVNNLTSVKLNNLPAKPLILNGRESVINPVIDSLAICYLIYKDTSFVLINGLSEKCPSGFSSIGDKACIETTKHDSLLFWDALTFCHSSGARLCTINEWRNGCTTGQLTDGFGSFEWTDNAGNFYSTQNDAAVGVIGEISCDDIYQGFQYTQKHTFRCCYTRKY